MSIFFPYSPDSVLQYIGNAFNLALSQLSDYETIILTVFANLYFFVFWFIIIYFALKIFNRIWERLF